MRKFSRLFVVLLALTLALPVLAQDEPPVGNLLINPGFEQPYDNFDDVMPRQLASGWLPWNLGAAADQPQYAPASAQNPDRILSGEDAQKLTFFLSANPSIAGVYQTVSGLEPDFPLTFAVNAYVYSTATEEDPDTSDTPNGVTIEVGIDPLGGADPLSPDIIWSEPAEQYDNYYQVAVSAAAQESTLTVFVRASIPAERWQTDIYLDDAILSDSALVSEPTPDDIDLPTEEIEPTDEVELPTDEVIPTETPDAAATEAADADILATAQADSLALTASFETVVAGITVVAATDEANTAVAVQATETAQADFDLTVTGVVAQATTDAQAEFDLTSTQQILEATGFQVAAEMTATGVVAQATADQLIIEATNLSLTIAAQDAELQQPSATPEVVVITATPEPIVPTETDTTPPVVEPTLTPVDESSLVPTTPTAVIPLSEIFPGRLVHTVQYGETVSILSARYGSSIDAIIAANGLNENALIYVGQGLIIPVRVPPIEESPTPAFVVVTATPGTGGDGSGGYIVRSGDTLSQIAARNNTTVRTLAQLNGIVNVNSIQVGQRLVLPGGAEPSVTPTPAPELISYVVLPGDSLYKIAITYKVSIQRLAEANRITNPNRIFVGQVLSIPQP